MKFSVMNLGCKVNHYESESIAGILTDEGFERVDFDTPSDIALIFTCAVTSNASSKSRQMVHRVKKLNPDTIVVAAGCYSQIDRDALSDAEIIVGSADKKQIPSYIHQYLETREKIVHISETEIIPFEDLTMNHSESTTRAYLKVQDGCNQFCTYCVIPYARGRERSMKKEVVISEAQRLSKTHKEIVLTGIHTGRYGRDAGTNLSSLIRELLDKTEVERIRISSIEVTEIDDELIKMMKENPRIARHLHIPLQSGCDSVLKRMNRPYTTDMYYEKLQKIRNEIPDISISCDVIVGFPMETDEEFNATYSFMQKCGFSFLHVFPFSARSGTKAAEMPCQINGTVKKERVARCMELSQNLYDSYKLKWIGKEADIIIEAPLDHAHGHSSQYLPIEIDGHYNRGDMIHIRITELVDHQLYGKKVTA